MRLLVAIIVGKLIAFLTQTLKLGGGSAAPGLYALKIEPEVIQKLISRIPKNIVITGTNGKTTTSRMIAHFAKESGLKVIRNHTGSNLERGIASALISSYSLLPVASKPILGIWELDEAAFNSAALKIKPDLVVFLNVFRDQLDRYGEIDTVVNKWLETLKKLPTDTTILVNGDDNNTLKLKNHFKGKIETFGVEKNKIHGESTKKPDKAINLDFEAKNVKLDGLSGSSFQITINQSLITINLPLPGVYHIYDAVAAIATAFHLNLPINLFTDQLISFQPAFGRVEKLPFGFIFLIKNPAGATQVFETIAPQLKPQDRLLLALNDNFADGTDVSWIWDIQLERLKIGNLKLEIVCSGKRAHELAIRLKYAGINPDNITIKTDLNSALQAGRAGLKGSLYILPTYTALLEFQRILAKIGVKKEYWKES
jgi:lipid II isoglutaminyl synthase (glutamine-hydrolysing)